MKPFFFETLEAVIGITLAMVLACLLGVGPLGSLFFVAALAILWSIIGPTSRRLGIVKWCLSMIAALVVLLGIAQLGLFFGVLK